MNTESSRSFYVSLIMMILFIIFGSFLILSPQATISFVSRSLAALMFLISLSGFIRYFMYRDKSKRIDYNLFYAIVMLMFAALLFFKDNAIEVLVAPVLGVFMLSNTSLRINAVSLLRRNKNNLYKLVLFIMLIEYISSLAVIFNVFGKVLTITQLVGFFVIFYFVIDFILVYLLKLITDKEIKLNLVKEV